MNIESISESLVATGFFSCIELTASTTQQNRLAATVSLTEKGHRAIAEGGVSVLQQGLDAATTPPVEFRFACSPSPWPAAAREKPEGLPAIWSHLEENGTHRLLLDIGPDLIWFKGHFPEQPILAGVVQLNWAGLLIQELFGFQQTPASIARLKFQHVVLPPAVLELTLACMSPQSVHFRYTSGDRVHSQGRLNFRESVS
jgi:hypothetical protein